MVGFLIGVFLGAGIGVAITAFMVAVSEDDSPTGKDTDHKDDPWRWEGWK